MIKVASYCRVSTDKNDQSNSFEAQKRYFSQYIEHHSDWILAEIYADEGISGTTTRKRTQFNRMMDDAYEGKFQMIITKEVSRFSRNILDTIAYTRELKAIGIGVIFAADRINTLDPEAELLLSYMASMAQEESRRTSTRVVWGQTRQMERGVVFGQSLLGYDLKEGSLTINPEGAETVRLIFRKYALEQVSTTEIARYLTREGYCTGGGNTNWRPSTIIKILKNEKYVGDLVQKKTYTPDFLTHAKKTNKGEVPFVAIKDHHAAIVSREIWDMAQRRLHQNNKHGAGERGHSNRYVFSGKIKCGECGSSFVGRFKLYQDGTKIRRWRCGTVTKGGVSACGVGRLLRDDNAMHMVRIAVNHISLDKKYIIRNLCNILSEVTGEAYLHSDRNSQRYKAQLNQVRRKQELLMDSYLSGEITKVELETMKRKYSNQLEILQQRQYKEQDTETRLATLQSEMWGILNGDVESDVFFKTILDSITVYKDSHMELRLNGLPHIFRFEE